jgi:hypothetical protein
MRKINALLVLGTVTTVTLIASVVPSSADSGGGSSGGADDVLRFDTMFAVVAPFTGATNPVHGVPGAGAPWVIDDADGRLERNGDIDVRVQGLVLVSTGQNPAAQFQAIVTCDTVVNGAVTTVNVVTDPFPADVAGNSRIRDTVALPDPCLSPTVFVGPVGGAPRWFAVTGR